MNMNEIKAPIKSIYSVDGWTTALAGFMHERWVYQVISASVVYIENQDEQRDMQDAFLVRVYDIHLLSDEIVLVDFSDCAYAANNECDEKTLVVEKACATKAEAVGMIAAMFVESAS